MGLNGWSVLNFIQYRLKSISMWRKLQRFYVTLRLSAAVATFILKTAVNTGSVIGTQFMLLNLLRGDVYYFECVIILLNVFHSVANMS